MGKRTILTTALLFLATTVCHARCLTLAEADTIIMILSFVIILLLILGGYSIHYSRVVYRRNEQLNRILNALNDYRAIVGDKELSLDEQEKLIKEKQAKSNTNKTVHTEEGQTFFVKMDARVNKEKPFTNPDFNQQALADFMEVDLETFRKLVPRYSDPDRTLEYINSLRAEYAAKVLMESSKCSLDDIAAKCGFSNTTSFNNAFKFAFGIMPAEYLNGVSQMFKKKAKKNFFSSFSKLFLAVWYFILTL
jgi:AraC-like DNA-binding protein